MKKEIKKPESNRIRSIDALRGFDMFWIMGFGAVIRQFIKVQGTPFWESLLPQFQHPYWHGFTFWDIIFPLFMFISGLTAPFSIEKQLSAGRSKQQILLKIVKRGLILVLLGVIYNARVIELRPLAEYRYASVLGKIGLSYIFACLIFLYSKPNRMIIWYTFILIGYWLLLKFTSAPGFPAGDMTEAGNFMSYFDRLTLPGILSREIHDTVGLLCTVTGVATTLSGVIAGYFLKNHPMKAIKKVIWFGIIGTGMILLALLWNLDFPINKNLWSSSFTLLTGGISLLAFALFYYIIDVKGVYKWSFFFRVIGMNSIFAYVSAVFIDYSFTAEKTFKWLGQLAGKYEPPVMALCTTFIVWLVLYLMYRKKIFLKI